MSGPNWKLEDDRKSVTLSLPTEPPASIQLDAAGVEDALNKLGEFRAAMSPVIPVTYEMGQKIDAIVHPIWATETEVTLGDTVLHFRDPRYGWLHYVLPREHARMLIGFLQVQVNAPRPDSK